MQICSELIFIVELQTLEFLFHLQKFYIYSINEQ